jgi:flotillin
MLTLSLLLLSMLATMAWFARLYRQAGPNAALVVYGVRGTRIIKGGGTMLVPMLERYQELSLELMSFDVAPEQDLFTRQGVAVTVEAVAQIKICSDTGSVETAAEQILSKTPREREDLIRLVMVGHLRGIVGQLTVEEIVKQPDMVSERMRSTCADDLHKMGLTVISFTIKEVRDKNEYIANMGRPDVARIRRDADVATAEAERDTKIRRAIAEREAAVARASADQERVLAETLSLTRQAEAEQDLQVRRAQVLETTQRQKAQADKSYEIQSNIMQQQLVLEQVRIQRVEREELAKVEEAEITRREKELIASVLKQVEVERQRIEMMADAERQRSIREAEGNARAIELVGLAEAGILRRKGEAEAAAMHAKAAAYQQYNQAAVVDRLIATMPELLRALASPLANVDKITVVSTGDSDTTGVNKLSRDMTTMAAQVPALLEAFTGLRLDDLMRKVRAISDDGERGRGRAVNGASAGSPELQPPE